MSVLPSVLHDKGWESQLSCLNFPLKSLSVRPHYGAQPLSFSFGTAELIPQPFVK